MNNYRYYSSGHFELRVKSGNKNVDEINDVFRDREVNNHQRTLVIVYVIHQNHEMNEWNIKINMR